MQRVWRLCRRVPPRRRHLTNAENAKWCRQVTFDLGGLRQLRRLRVHLFDIGVAPALTAAGGIP